MRDCITSSGMAVQLAWAMVWLWGWSQGAGSLALGAMFLLIAHRSARPGSSSPLALAPSHVCWVVTWSERSLVVLSQAARGCIDRCWIGCRAVDEACGVLLLDPSRDCEPEARSRLPLAASWLWATDEGTS